jgi:hypothetical protein
MGHLYRHRIRIAKPQIAPKREPKEPTYIPTPEVEEKNRIIKKIESLPDTSELWSIENWYERKIEAEEIVNLSHNDKFSKEVKPTIRKLDTYVSKYLQSSTELSELEVLGLEQRKNLSYLKQEYEVAKLSFDEAMDLEREALKFSSNVDAYREFILDHDILDLHTGRRGKEEISKRHEYEETKTELDETNDEIKRLSAEMRKLVVDYISNVGVLRSTIYKFSKQFAEQSHQTIDPLNGPLW